MGARQWCYHGAMMLPRMPVAIVFDMDGLLFDTEALYQEAAVAAAEEEGHDVSSGIIFRLIGLPWQQGRALLLGHFGDGFPVDDFETAWLRRFWLMAESGLALKPGVVELLDALDELKLPRAIATSSAHRTVRHHLAAHDLVGRFDAIVGHGDYAAGKPAPDPFLTAAERLGVAPTACLALEDSHNGVRSAAAAGMMTIMVPDCSARPKRSVASAPSSPAICTRCAALSWRPIGVARDGGEPAGPTN
jgi:HAD superfamily hydrolase (TIGR01509 family)